MNTSSNRRQFLAQSGRFMGGSWMALNLSAILATAEYACQAREEGRAFEILSENEAQEIEAIATQIIPTTDTPGAREAGVIYFIDRALNTFMAGAETSLRQGLEALQASCKETYGVASFHSLAEDQQIDRLKQIEQGPFFGMLRYLTVAGTFSHPDYGGNHNKIGWQLLGFQDQHAWQPPFGYYDEQYQAEKAQEDPKG